MQERYELSIRTAEIALGEKRWNQVSGILSGVSPCSEAYYPKRTNASDSMYITSVQRRNRRECDGLVYHGLAEMMHVWSIERSVYPRSLLKMDAIKGRTSKGRESLNFVLSESFMRECFISRTLSLDLDRGVIVAR